MQVVAIRSLVNEIGFFGGIAIEGEETAVFEGDRMRRLEDRFGPDAGKSLMAWMQEHGAKLGSE